LTSFISASEDESGKQAIGKDVVEAARDISRKLSFSECAGAAAMSEDMGEAL
jgi:hypothetical protein